MNLAYFRGIVVFIGVFCAVGVQAQKPESVQDRASKQVSTAISVAEESASNEQSRAAALPPGTIVPPLIRFSGIAKDQLGNPRSGKVGITFAVYKDLEGGAPLWLETQNVELDEQGRYTALLGTTKNEGLPVELFTTAEPRWLGWQLQLPGEVEQPRVLLVSVPYALKAADAETLGGLHPSAFMLAPAGETNSPASGQSSKSTGKTATSPTPKSIGAATTIGGGGNPNVVTKFDSTGANVINSSITDNGSRISVGEGIDFSGDFSFVGNANPAPTGRVQMFDQAFVGFVIRGLNILFQTLQGTPAAPVEAMRITQNGNVGIGTASPAFTLDVAGTGNFNGTSAGLKAAAANNSGVGVSGSANGSFGTGILGSAFGQGGMGVVGQAGIDTNAGIAIFGSAGNASSVAGQFGNESGGNILIGTGAGVAKVFRVDATGKVFANGGFSCPNATPSTCLSTGSADFAEAIEPLSGENAYEPADVLVIDSMGKRRVSLSREPYSTNVAGIYSTKPAVLGGAPDGEMAKSRIPLAMVGIVPCKVSAENGSIAAGDLLVTSSTAGHAMKGTDRTRMLGAVVGKALEALSEGKGVIQVLVTLQ